VGRVGADFTTEEGYEAAKLCGLNLIAQVKAACGGDLERVVRVVRLGGFVNCTADFTDQPKVINGASDLMAAVFGDKGKHARAAVGVNTLPLGVAVEVEGLFEIQ
jgi:enamine deaminase RidA (YjgF/YER057c/UK114 family)